MPSRLASMVWAAARSSCASFPCVTIKPPIKGSLLGENRSAPLNGQPSDGHDTESGRFVWGWGWTGARRESSVPHHPEQGTSLSGATEGKKLDATAAER